MISGYGFFLSSSFLKLITFWLCHRACGMLVPQPGIELLPTMVEVQSLNHCTTREVPEYGFCNSKFLALGQYGNIMCLSNLHINRYFSNNSCFHIEQEFLIFHSYTYILTFSLPSLFHLLTPNPAHCPKEIKKYPSKNC